MKDGERMNGVEGFGGAGRELSMPEIHQVTLEMMDYIHQVCEENGIPYYLAYGTLIGAVRHRGFIPWDDDFDIQMTRENLEKFRAVMARKNHPFYRLCDRKNTAHYFYGIPRFSDSRFRYVSTLPGAKPFDNGIFIDIYPLDSFGNSMEEARRIKRKVDRLNIMFEIYVNEDMGEGKLMTLARRLSHRALRLRYGDKLSERIDDMVYDVIRRNTSPDDSLIGDACWDAGYVVPYRREWIAERILHPFEDRQYWIPACYDKILTEDYGDYMTLPPKEKRVPQHHYKIVRV